MVYTRNGYAVRLAQDAGEHDIYWYGGRRRMRFVYVERVGEPDISPGRPKGWWRVTDSLRADGGADELHAALEGAPKVTLPFVQQLAVMRAAGYRAPEEYGV